MFYSFVKRTHDRNQQLIHFVKELFAERGNCIILAVCTALGMFPLAFQETLLFKRAKFLVEIVPIDVEGAAGDIQDFILYFVCIPLLLSNQIQYDELEKTTLEIENKLVGLLLYGGMLISGHVLKGMSYVNYIYKL